MGLNQEAWAYPEGQDSFLFHSQNMTVAARAMAERKTFLITHVAQPLSLWCKK